MRSTVPTIFNGGNGGPYSARGNQFAKRDITVFGPGELIRQGNFYGMTDVCKRLKKGATVTSLPTDLGIGKSTISDMNPLTPNDTFMCHNI